MVLVSVLRRSLIVLRPSITSHSPKTLVRWHGRGCHTTKQNPAASGIDSSSNQTQDTRFEAFEHMGGSSGGDSGRSSRLYDDSDTDGYSEDESYRQQDHQHQHEDEKKFKAELLDLALKHVPSAGWSTRAIASAAEEAGLASTLNTLFRESDLVLHFIQKSNNELEDYLAATYAKRGPFSIREALEYRLKLVVPYAKNYSDAIAISTKPEHLRQSVTLLLELADSIAHYSLNDMSADMTWYAKRLSLAGIYASTELSLVQDTSEGYSETWKFLDRRVSEFNRMEQSNFSITSVPIPELCFAGLVTFRNIIGINYPR